MAARKKRVGVPTAVLDRASELTRLAVKPQVPAAPVAKAKLLPREKVVAALKKLHPMD